ncbi:FHA domain-containing protein [Aporhodopirellula aestuarii]|uniref:FHA domain-containing protein n=1 Tax=Aporhodopirellula aestuarii TaxID=2950107 RepID=UPI0020332179|nr:hypothetical protein [Aporhodopirellula aestuarii]
MANEHSQFTPSATTSLDEAAASFEVSSWQSDFSQPSMTGNAVSTTAKEESLGRRTSSDDQNQAELDRWAQTPSTWRRDPSIEFRVRCEGQPTRRLRLAGARYTLGSGVGCSIRLEDETLRPLHAVLIRDHERILVRAYSVPIQINNVRVTEGMISVGDRLKLGAYEFELLENTPRPVDAVSQAVAHGLVGFDGHADSRGEDASQDWSKSFHEEAKQWRALKQDVQRRDAWCKTRERELVEQQRTLEQQMQTLQQREEELQTQESAAIEVHEEFQRRYQDLLKHRDELQLQQEELSAGREHLRLQQERLDGRDRLHRQQIERLLEEQDRYKRQETIHQQKIAEGEERIRASRLQAEAATSAVEQMREKFASLNEQLVLLSQQQETLQQLEAERNRDHQRRVEDLEFDRDEAIAQRDEIAEERDASIEAQAKSESARKKLAVRCVELESIEEQLRNEIEELQSEIASARLDAESLDKDCELARRTITNLEETIRENRERYENDRDSWTAEVETLRTNLEELSVDLAGAQAQLSRLREENQHLVDQLTGAHAERDEARAEREAALQECEVARGACDAAKMDCEAARRDLESARNDVILARQERDDAAAQRNAVLAERDELLTLKARLGQDNEAVEIERANWVRQQEQAERRYQEAQSHLADARQKCEQAVRVRDEAESARLAAEAKLQAAMQELQEMQAERDHAIREQDELRRQRDSALQDAKDSRELFDRSNRDHDDTLDRIEHLEQQTRQVIGVSDASFKSDSAPEPTSTPKFGLIGNDLPSTDIESEVTDTSELALDNDDDQSIDLHPEPSSAGENDILLASDAPQWEVETNPDAQLATPHVNVEPESDEPSAAAEDVGSFDTPNDVPTSHTVTEEATSQPAAAWATEPSESIDDQDVWPTYSSVEPRPENRSDEEQSTSMSYFSETDDVVASDLPSAMPPVPTEESASAWQSTEEAVHADDSVAEEPVAETPVEEEPVTEEPVLADEPVVEASALVDEQAFGDEPQSEIVDEPASEDQTSDEPNWRTTASDEQSESEMEPETVQPVAEDLPAWPEESQTYLLPREQYESDEQIDSPVSDATFDSQESVEAVGSFDVEPPYTSSFADDSQDEWSNEDEASEPSSDIATGSLADQLMRDLGITPKEHSSHDGDDADAASLDDNSATAMWNGRNDWQSEDVAEEAPANEVQEEVSADEAEEATPQLKTGIDQYREDFHRDEYESEDDVQDEISKPNVTAVADTVVAGASDSGSGEPEDDSIEAYMNRLLQRVQGQPSSSPTSPAPVAPKKVAKPVEPVAKEVPSATSETNENEVTSKEQPVAPDPDAPLVPRSQAPERNSDLSAMRELANASARSAITRSHQTQSHTTRMQAMMKFGQAGIAMLCGLAAVALVNLPMLKIVAAVAALLIAAICVKEGLALLTDLSSRTQTARNSEAAIEESENKDAV